MGLQAFEKDSFTWLTWPCRINIYTVLECDTGHVLLFFLPGGDTEMEKLRVGKIH